MLNNFTEMFFHDTLYSNGTNDFAQPNIRSHQSSRHLLNHWSKFKTISQNCFSQSPGTNCTNGSVSLNKEPTEL